MVFNVGVYCKINFHLLNETIEENVENVATITKHVSLAGQTLFLSFSILKIQK